MALPQVGQARLLAEVLGAAIERHAPRSVAVLQLPSPVPEITPSPYSSLAPLGTFMQLVPPDALARCAADHGYALVSTETLTASGGKRFAAETLRIDREDPE